MAAGSEKETLQQQSALIALANINCESQATHEAQDFCLNKLNISIYVTVSE